MVGMGVRYDDLLDYICGDIEKLCPDATVFCYSNPMTAICTTVKRRFLSSRWRLSLGLELMRCLGPADENTQQ